MRILRLHIDGFGCLKNFDLELTAGLNSIHEENGWGKSTLAAFIKAMLFGLPATTKRSLDENERKKYTPWDHGSFGGSLEFDCRAGRFRVERVFAQKESQDQFTLYDLNTNLPSTAFSKELGMELFGIDGDGFERSTYLSQRACAEKCDSGSISARLSGLLSDVDDADTFDRALEALEKRRKFYVMTGNRGAIAQAEQELFAISAECERCAAVADAAEEKRQELATLQEQIEQVGHTLEGLQKEWTLATEQRERAAHLEHRQRTCAQLAGLKEQMTDIEHRFSGALPTEEESKNARILYERIRDARAKRAAIPQSISEAEELGRLQKRYAGGFPTPEEQKKLENDNRRLLELRARFHTVRNHLEEDPSDVRFANGAPSSEQINRAFDTLRTAEKIEKEIKACKETQSPPRHLPFLLPMILLLILGILASVLPLLPSLAPVGNVLWIIGGCSLLGCVILLVLSLATRAKRKTLFAKQARELESKHALHERLMAELRTFLARYGTEQPENVADSLTELNMLITQHRAASRQRIRFREEYATLQKQWDQLCANMQHSLSRYLANVPQRSDYQTELDRLRTDSEQYARLQAEERRRAISHASAERTCEELQNELLPFLRRYAPSEKLRAGECLAAMQDDCALHRRLQQEYAQKEAELKQFLAKKHLDEVTAPTRDVDTILSEHRMLQDQRNELTERQGLLKSALERLCNEADRLPDLEADRNHHNARLSEYRANYSTVSATAQLLSEAKNALSTRYLTELQEGFGRILELLSEVSDQEVLIDPTFTVRLRQGGKTHAVESYSRGWQDLIRFALHLSLSEALYPDGEKPFLLLDDPFVNLDERHLSAAMHLIELLSKDRQIVYMVCHKDRMPS